MRTTYTLPLFFAFFLAGCGTAPLQEDEALAGRYHPSGKDGTREMLETISTINKHSPEYYTADFAVNGSRAEKRYRLIGSLQFGKKQRRLYVSFLDFIFRSPLTTLFQEGDEIRIYYPAEKKMYVDSLKRIDLSNYGGINIDFELLAGLIAGSVPVIPGYSVRQGLTANDEKGSLLILENTRFYETISFKEKYPDKIKLVDKSSGEELEVYMDRPVSRAEGRVFSNIIIVSKDARIKLDINFTRIVLNTPVKVKTYRDVPLPRDLKIIQM